MTNSTPRVFKKTIGGITVRAYNDSGCEWVVYSPDAEVHEIRLQMRLHGHRLTMARAIEMFANINNLSTN